jgi:hypothetical protein
MRAGQHSLPGEHRGRNELGKQKNATDQATEVHSLPTEPRGKDKSGQQER